jgi:hypothetical protein
MLFLKVSMLEAGILETAKTSGCPDCMNLPQGLGVIPEDVPP